MTNTLLRIGIFVALILAALFFYSMGVSSGAFALILIGMTIEGAAWFTAFKRKKSGL